MHSSPVNSNSKPAKPTSDGERLTTPSPAETFLRSFASARAAPLSQRQEPTQLLRWTTDEETITEPMWLARWARFLDLLPNQETELPPLQKPSEGHPWERVVRRRCRRLGISVEMLAERMDEDYQRIRLLFYFPALWQSLEPRLSRALSTTSYALSAAIEQETIRCRERREEAKKKHAERKDRLQRRRERTAQRRTDSEG